MTSPDQYPMWLGVIMVAALGFFFKHHFNSINEQIDKKASKAEIDAVRLELREAREARERDLERMERIANERYQELSNTMNRRIDDLERHLAGRLDTILQHVRQQ